MFIVELILMVEIQVMTIKLASSNLFHYFYAILDYYAVLFIHNLFFVIDALLFISS
jgi:hypothetical protein